MPLTAVRGCVTIADIKEDGTAADEIQPITSGKPAQVNRQVKDSVFSDLFSNKTNLLALYRALHPEDESATENDIANVTVQNVLIVDLYNDLGFTVRDKLLLLVEAQSTWTENIVLRLFLYLAETLAQYIKTTGQNVYGTKKLTLPHAELYVIFTGERGNKPDVITLRDEGTLEIKARVIFANEDSTGNGNADGNTNGNGANLDIIQQYIAFSKELDKQIKAKGRTAEALRAAIKTCKQRNILRDYLTTREKEVVKTMSILFDQEYVTEVALKERETIGAHNKAISTAKNLLEMGLLSLEQIAQATKLPLSEVAAL